jgi:hypothetical protein
MMDDIKTDLKAVGWEGMDCIYMASNRDNWRISLKMAMILRTP